MVANVAEVGGPSLLRLVLMQECGARSMQSPETGKLLLAFTGGAGVKGLDSCC